MDLSIIIPCYNEGKNLAILLPKLHKTISKLTDKYEILIIDNNSKDRTAFYCKKYNAKLFQQKEKGYGSALNLGFERTKGRYIITMDGDLSHNPSFIIELWKNKDKADILISSRYVKEGSADISFSRRILSTLLNKIFAYILATPLNDLSSGFRLYNSYVLKDIKPKGIDFNILQEIIVRAYSEGYKIKEIPFHYSQRSYGKSKAKLLKFGISYLKTLRRLWFLRNSLNSADYDERAFNSKIPLQRYWQRKRYKIIMSMLDDKKNILDIGCGSSKIIQNLKDAVALDFAMNKLRYIKKTNKFLINADATKLPFKDSSFKTVICSEVLEHVKNDKLLINEAHRVLKNNGVLIIGTPDYNKTTWKLLERAHGFFIGDMKNIHITQHTFRTLSDLLKKKGFKILNYKYIFNSELIFKARKIR